MRGDVIGKMTDKNYLVSIVTATFNLIDGGRKEYFCQMVESVRSQTYKNIEHIIVDGGSKDGTIELLNEYAEKGLITYISEPDKGIFDAMNKGAKLAKGDLITFLNSDDFFSDNTGIERSVKLFDEDIAYSYAPLMNLDEEKNIRKVFKIKWLRALRNMPYPHPGMLVRKNVFDKLGGFDTQFKLVADYDLILRLMFNGYKGRNVKKIFATFRLGGASDIYANKQKEEIKRVYCKNYAEIGSLSDEDCNNMAETYIFPNKLLKPLMFGKYPKRVKISAFWLFLNGLKRRLKQK